MTDIERKKLSESQKGRIVIHKDDSELRIYKESLDEYVKQGWSVGYSDKHKKILSKNRLDKEPWNKGKTGYHIQNKSKFVKKQIPWNKGKKTGPVSDEVRKKLSAMRKGKKKSAEWRKKIGDAQRGRTYKWSKEKLLIKLSKEYITKKKNNSFNISKKEEEFYAQLKELNRTKTIYRQYKDERYPFYCDFYILEDDLFIEVNFHWTHGGRPFVSNDEDCQKQLLEWQEKAKTSKFYQNAIYTWTVRDVNKLNIAKKNNLNYKVIY